MAIDATSAALLGALIGGASGIIGTIITVIYSGRREVKSFERLHTKEHFERVCSAYEFALNIFFNFRRGGGNPDRASYGDMFAHISLYGSPEVRALLEAWLSGPQNLENLEIEKIIAAMQAHLASLKNEIK